ncbi:uncharacterized protein [Dysidea avara]|uniref:uncharacterized protein isoform X2 n=1 Tax=Dysidea avara TaxID=196820 RepID=UPI0033293682
MKRMYEDSETTDRSANDEKELVTPPASKYGEKFVFEKSYPLVTSDLCKQLQHAIDNVRILRLKNLNLGEYLPDGLLEFTPSSCIEELDLSMTRLNILPASIGKLQSLKRLYLDHNGLKTLPFSISHCTYLTYLSVTFNKFSYFPGVLLSLTCLADLRRQSNPTQPSLSLLAGARPSNYIRRTKCSPSKSDVKSTGEVPSLREMVMHTAVLSNIGRPYWKNESIPYMIVRQLDLAQNDYLICDSCHCAVHKDQNEAMHQRKSLYMEQLQNKPCVYSGAYMGSLYLIFRLYLQCILLCQGEIDNISNIKRKQ